MRGILSSAIAASVAVGAVVACGSFSPSSETTDAGASSSDGGSSAVDASSDVSIGSAPACTPASCASTDKTSCTSFDAIPGPPWIREKGDISQLFVPDKGCPGGAMVVSAPALVTADSDRFYAELGTSVPSKVHVEFDVRYALGAGTFARTAESDGFIDFIEVATAPWTQREGSMAIAIGGSNGEAYATVYQPPDQVETKGFTLTQGTWHRMSVTVTLGVNASTQVDVDATRALVFTSKLAISGNGATGASVAFGRLSGGIVPAIEIAIDNVTIVTE